MCEHCFNQFDFTLPSGVRVCGQCFEEMYCRACWQHTNVVGARTNHNDMMMCATCANNTPPQPAVQFDEFDDIYDEIPNNIIDNITPINDYDGTFAAPLLDEYMTQDNYEEDEPWPVAPIEDEGYDGPMVDISLVLEYMEQNHHIPLYEPPAGFDMNSASLVEQNPDYMDNLINSQIEYQGKWYFVLDGQIYSVPQEIEIDDDYDRRDIKDNWDNVEWTGTIFGEYVAWF